MKTLNISGTSAAIIAHTCPTCGAVIKAQAVVNAFGEPPNWLFWGEPDNRWRRCVGTVNEFEYVHFRVGHNDRLAWMRRNDEK